MSLAEHIIDEVYELQSYDELETVYQAVMKKRENDRTNMMAKMAD